VSDDQPRANSDPLLCLNVAEDENDSDEGSSCCSDASVEDSSSDDDGGDFDLNDLHVGSATNESCGPRHDNDVTVVDPVSSPDNNVHVATVVNTIPFPTRPSDFSLTASVNRPMTSGYVIVGDNIDKNVRPSYQRHDRTTRSLHYFHSYALMNRVNTTQLSDDRPSSIDISPDNFLPSSVDAEKLLSEFEVLVARYCMVILLSVTLILNINLCRILVQSMDQFKDQQSLVTWHIPSAYSKEMSCKSEVVCLLTFKL